MYASTALKNAVLRYFSMNGDYHIEMINSVDVIYHFDTRNHNDLLYLKNHTMEFELAAILPARPDEKWFGYYVLPEDLFPDAPPIQDRRQKYATAKEARAELRKLRNSAIEKEREIQANPAAWLSRELAYHDWYHMMSSDHRKVVGGRLHKEKIMEIAKQVPAPLARSLWYTHAPTPPNSMTCWF